MTTDAPPAEAPAGPIVARGNSYYRNMRLIFCVVMIAAGAWFANDGFVNYPRSEQTRQALLKKVDDIKRDSSKPKEVRSKEAEEVQKRADEFTPHSNMDIMLQKLLCFALPILGLALLIWSRYNSRGEIRLDGDMLSVPGHPPVSLNEITLLDSRLWDRKGIAYADYQSAAGAAGRLRLDDCIYEAYPIRDIYKRVEATMKEAEAQNTHEETNTAEQDG